ncbi:MAG: lipid-A-disaccharide synthase [Verrucomicrobiia bacterium]|jgi:lipid-A-disaccharide synthase
MKRIKVMFIAGETSGDTLAAELAPELKKQIIQKIYNTYSDSPFPQPLFTTLEPKFFGAGGEKMKSAGVDVNFNLVKHSAIGPVDALKNYKFYKNIFDRLIELAFCELPDLVVCVDFSGFNIRFAEALKKEINRHKREFFRWSPKIVQYVSPQVWASRPWRAKKLEKYFDLLLSIFPFEKDWYEKNAPGIRIEFVGHPIVDRYPKSDINKKKADDRKRILLLPGSRFAELKRHLPVMIDAANRVRAKIPDAQFMMALSDDELKNYAMNFVGSLDGLVITIGDLKTALLNSDAAIASTGTVTLECAYFKLPTVAIYKTSPLTYFLGKQLIKVKFLAMPNLIANEVIFPELIQNNATAEKIAEKTLEILDSANRERIADKLTDIVKALGEPGAVQRAAKTIADILI